MATTDPAKRIPKSIGTDAKLFGSYTLSDVAVALFPGVLVVLVVQVLLPPGFTLAGYPIRSIVLPLAGLAIAIGATFVYLTPAYTSSINWLASFLRFHRSHRELGHVDARASLQIERVYPDRNVIERTDGAFIGLLEVEPPAMSLATDAEWTRVAEAFADVCNTVVEFPVQFYSTTRRFPADTYLSTYRERLNDPDVRANPRLGALIAEYVAWYAADLEARRMTIRDHYVVVSVAPEEVAFEHRSVFQPLGRVPLVGVLLRVWFARGRPTRSAVMADALDDRLRRLETALRGIEGCGAHRVSIDEATRLIAEFWAGEPVEYGDAARVLRTRPLVGGSS